MTRGFYLLTLLLSLSLAAVGEFLGVVPGARPEELAGRFRVVDQLKRSLLVLGEADQKADVAGMGGKVLDENPGVGTYFRVLPLGVPVRSDLERIGTILHFDGNEYIVRVPPGATARFSALRVMSSRIFLSPMVLKGGTPPLPRVTRDPAIQEIVDSVSPDSILACVRRLQEFYRRFSDSDSCRAAAQWVAGKFQAFGCDSVVVQDYDTSLAPNVIGVKFGSGGARSPYSVICGHIDGVPESPAADDNGSGVAATVEACRVMSGSRFINDIRFIAFTGEEDLGLVGSEAYARESRGRGDSILGVLNFDMIGSVSAAPESLELVTRISNPPCEPFADFFAACADTYTTLLCNKLMVDDSRRSDQGSFWRYGYVGFGAFEDFPPVNPWYHTAGDSIGTGYSSNEFCTEVTRAGVAALATVSGPVAPNAPRVVYLRHRIDDETGNRNGRWDPGESVAVSITLKNVGPVGATDVDGTLSAADPYVELSRIRAAFGNIPAGESATNVQPFTMRAAPDTPKEHRVGFDLSIATAETTGLCSFSLQIGDLVMTDPIPDGPRVPPLYWAYDDGDSGFPEHPTFDWVEVNQGGTRILFANNDDVVPVSLPAAFGAFRFYDRVYDRISVSADGWICPGEYTVPNFSNTPLPDANTPPGLIALNWDDLYPDRNGAGHVYWHFDSARHCVVVEYDSVSYYSPEDVKDKFEVLIYDTLTATATGNSIIVAQYLTANRCSSSTFGIEDPTRSIAIQVLCDGGYAHGAAAIVPGRVIKYITSGPVSISEKRPAAAREAAGITVFPNPIRNSAAIRCAPPVTGRVELRVFDAAGRSVHCAETGQTGAATTELRWTRAGLPDGVYFLRLRGPTGTAGAKVVVEE